METKQILEHLIRHKFPTQLAATSFAIGTLLFFGFILFPKIEEFILIGFAFVIIAILFNLLTFIFLLYQYFSFPEEKFYNQFQILIMLTNIPVSILYFFLISIIIKNNSPF